MSYEDKKIKCVACGAYLFDEDDVVFCPECGAPHHRECYNRIGKCALFDKHGTNEEYDSSKNQVVIEPDSSNSTADEKTKCPMCGSVLASGESNCPNCGVPLSGRTGRTLFTFDYLGGVPADLDLGEGVTADEAKQFVFSNSQRYIPKFAAFKLGKKTSFNWFAFLFPCGWFLSRKMYKPGAIIGTLQIVFLMLFMPFNNALEEFAKDATTYSQVLNAAIKNAGKIGKPAIICAFIAVLALVAISVLCGIFGDYMYKNHTVKCVKKIKAESVDKDADFRKMGGVSFLLFIAGVLVVEYLPGIIFSFI